MSVCVCVCGCMRACIRVCVRACYNMYRYEKTVKQSRSYAAFSSKTVTWLVSV